MTMLNISKNDYSILDKYIAAGQLKSDSSYVFTLNRKYIVFSRFSGKRYSYSVLNYITEKTALLTTSRTELVDKDFPLIVKKIIHSKVYRFEFPSHPETLVAEVFRDILPQYGYTVREKQIELSQMMLDSMRHKRAALCEAEVGTGKTIAYLIAGIVYGLYEARQRPAGRNVSTTSLSPLPIIITTSSIDLQQEIIGKFIPELSNILMEYRIIGSPISAILRKGKEHYLCRERYEDFMNNLIGSASPKNLALCRRLKAQRITWDKIDLDAYADLKQHIVHKINVPKGCDRTCPAYDECGYIRLMSDAKSGRYTFQITNHNYYLANAQREHMGLQPILQGCGVHIIDEAHKLTDAAYQIFGSTFSSSLISEFSELLQSHVVGNKANHRIEAVAGHIQEHNNQLFSALRSTADLSDENDEISQISVKINGAIRRTMRILQAELDEAYRVFSKNISDCRQFAYLYHEIAHSIEVFLEPGHLIYWLEKDEDEFWQLAAIPSNIPDILYDVLWKNNASKILTSATITTDADFSFFKSQTGLDRLSVLQTAEIRMASPFDFTNHTRLYISEKVPFPDKNGEEYILAVADEIGSLAEATYGHAIVLFTSYKLLAAVHDRLKKRITRFPLLATVKGTKNAAEVFRNSKNGVLLASGSFWEGIDCPGDVLSSIIIVNLPFPVPSPVMEFQKKDYPSLYCFIDRVAVPMMLHKLRQGLGRLIRLETDTGIVAILDSRVNSKGRYRNRILNSIPNYPLANSTGEIRHFIEAVKNPEYFC
jgi:ATP-dependent DNA helicase DinG